MRLALVVTLALVGCASLPDGRTEETGARGPAVVLRRVVAGERETYRREQSLAVLDDGQGAALSIVARSRLEQRPFADGAVLEHVVYLGLDLTRDGAPTEAPANVSGLERLVVRSVLDARGESIEGPQPVGRPATSADTQSVVLAVLRLLRPVLPDGPVALGARWSVPPIDWDSPPGHRLALVVEPTFTLRRLDRDVDGAEVALIDWDAPFRVLPFAALAGTTLEGTGHIRGTSRVRTSDGLARRTELDIEVSVGPSGAALMALFRFNAKYVDVLTPLPPGPRELVSGVVPIDPRAVNE